MCVCVCVCVLHVPSSMSVSEDLASGSLKRLLGVMITSWSGGGGEEEGREGGGGGGEELKYSSLSSCRNTLTGFLKGAFICLHRTWK